MMIMILETRTNCLISKQIMGKTSTSFCRICINCFQIDELDNWRKYFAYRSLSSTY